MKLFNKQEIGFRDMMGSLIKKTSELFNQTVEMFSPASAYGQIVTVLQNVYRLVLFFIQDSITELNLVTAKRDASIQGMAALTGHNIQRGRSAIGELNVTYSPNNSTALPGSFVYLVHGTKLTNKINSLTYCVILPDDDVKLQLTEGVVNKINIAEGKLETQTFQGTGENLQTLQVNVSPGQQIDERHVIVEVNGERISHSYESFYDLPYGEGCIVKSGIQSGVDIVFGTDAVGFVPDDGAIIQIEYLVTNGYAGNDPSTSSVYTFDDTGIDILGNDVDLNDYFTISVSMPPAFGANAEPIELTRLLLNKNSRNHVLNSPQDYAYTFKKMNLFSIVDCSLSEDADNIINIFLVPDISKRISGEEDYFSMDISKFSLTSTEITRLYDSIEKSGRKIIGTDITIEAPTIRYFIMNIFVDVFETHKGLEDIIYRDIRSVLSDHFINLDRKNIIPESDIIRLIEDVDGIDSVKVSFLSRYDEEKLVLDSTHQSVYINDTGSIVVSSLEYPVIRGGWTDHQSVYYDDDFNTGADKPSSVNIYINRYTKANAGVISTSLSRL